jgi:hypothetical protein
MAYTLGDRDSQKENAMKRTESMEKGREMFVQDDDGWLGEIRDALSPYWATRFEIRPESQDRVMVLEARRRETGASR